VTPLAYAVVAATRSPRSSSTHSFGKSTPDAIASSSEPQNRPFTSMRQGSPAPSSRNSTITGPCHAIAESRRAAGSRSRGSSGMERRRLLPDPERPGLVEGPQQHVLRTAPHHDPRRLPLVALGVAQQARPLALRQDDPHALHPGPRTQRRESGDRLVAQAEVGPAVP